MRNRFVPGVCLFSFISSVSAYSDGFSLSDLIGLISNTLGRLGLEGVLNILGVFPLIFALLIGLMVFTFIRKFISWVLGLGT